MPTLTLIDTLGIQNFVFATNRLRHAVAGSALVDRLGQWIEHHCGASSMIFAAGGNAALRFPDVQQARSAMTRLSRRIHDEAPGLEFVAVHRDFTPGGLAQAVLDAQMSLQQEKLQRRPSVPLLGLSVTTACVETHLPAVDFESESPTAQPQPVATGVLSRLGIQTAWTEFLPSDHSHFHRDSGASCSLRFPTEVDRLGRTHDDSSLLGVVHIDGNGIGRAVACWLRQLTQEQISDDELCQRYRQLSDALAALGRRAFEAVVRRVCGAIRCVDSSYRLWSHRRCTGFSLNTINGLNLPVRPIILGGDDLTFVCDGRIALELAAVALETFQQATIEPLGNVRACAGVAIARTHAPISRIYSLAEELCKSAKRFLRDEQRRDACAIDWHLGSTSPTETLEDLRRRQYQQTNRRLTRRPYFLSDAQRGWDWLTGVVDGFASGLWADRRSKVKQLPDLARQGPAAIEQAFRAWRTSAPSLSLPSGIPQNGYHGNATSLLDAVELLDFHLPLDTGD